MFHLPQALGQNQRRMISNHLPEEYKIHLLNGGKLVFVATPMDKKAEVLVWAVDLKWMYDAKILPTGSWVGDPVKRMPKDLTPERLFEANIHAIGELSRQVGGAILDVNLAVPDTKIHNN